ncbi:MAG: ATP-dependent DNA ligase [Microbacteriaceae bacterium]
MGKFIYDGHTRVDLDDRVLAHLQVVIANKLRRNEPFLFSWRDDVSTGDGRTSIWVHPACSLVFKYYGTRKPRLNLAWIDALAYAANSTTGLHVVPEPPEDGQDASGDE